MPGLPKHKVDPSIKPILDYIDAERLGAGIPELDEDILYSDEEVPDGCEPGEDG